MRRVVTASAVLRLVGVLGDEPWAGAGFELERGLQIGRMVRTGEHEEAGEDLATGLREQVRASVCE